jgi:hypothetical protein
VTRPGMTEAQVRAALYGREAMRAGEPVYYRGQCADHGDVPLDQHGRCTTCLQGAVVVGGVPAVLAARRAAAVDQAHDLALLEAAARTEPVEAPRSRVLLYRPTFRMGRRA